MIAALAVCAIVFATAGLAGGLYLAGRFAWPRKLYDALFAERR